MLDQEDEIQRRGQKPIKGLASDSKFFSRLSDPDSEAGPPDIQILPVPPAFRLPTAWDMGLESQKPPC